MHNTSSGMRSYQIYPGIHNPGTLGIMLSPPISRKKRRQFPHLPLRHKHPWTDMTIPKTTADRDDSHLGTSPAASEDVRCHHVPCGEMPIGDEPSRPLPLHLRWTAFHATWVGCPRYVHVPPYTNVLTDVHAMQLPPNPPQKVPYSIYQGVERLLAGAVHRVPGVWHHLSNSTA
ncbi:hypothetical protein BDV59DRAFT_50677 [Aspergillus ambiguus]|uniref:uncharacterized protein n=1 Tax=Aspergillus ambiguus TaxID=176160 RepID=UPI003CCD8B4C